MQQFMDKFFGPLDVTYCNYFYVISVFGFVAFFMAALNLVFKLVNKKKLGAMELSMCVQGGLMYFLNRLLYSMCSRSLN